MSRGGTSTENTQLSPKWFQERTPPPKGHSDPRGELLWALTDSLRFFGHPSVLWHVDFRVCPRDSPKKMENRLFKGTVALIRRDSESRQISHWLDWDPYLRNSLASNWTIPSSTRRWQPGLEPLLPQWLRVILPFNPSFFHHGLGLGKGAVQRGLLLGAEPTGFSH